MFSLVSVIKEKTNMPFSKAIFLLYLLIWCGIDKAKKKQPLDHLKQAFLEISEFTEHFISAVSYFCFSAGQAACMAPAVWLE